MPEDPNQQNFVTGVYCKNPIQNLNYYE